MRSPGHRISEVRKRDGIDRAIIFIHGFSGSFVNTWGSFPTLIGTEAALHDWDILSLGYSTSMLPDIRSVWSADPDLPIIALHLITRLQVPPLAQYRSLAIVAHSMGGLVAQRALLDSPDLVPRIKHVVFYGTPSGGLTNAGFLRFVKPQLRNMAAKGPFVTELRREWAERFDDSPPFQLLVVAGDRDQFVPPQSSLNPFPSRFRRVVAGDHLSMIKAEDAHAESLRLLVAALSVEAEPPAASSPLLTQAHDMSGPEAEQALAARRSRATEVEVVTAAIKLDLDGKRQQAVELLERHLDLGTDVKGTLGGRFKRLSLETGEKRYAERALDLYRDGLAAAEAANDREQAYYHAINLAFLAYVTSRENDERASKIEAEKWARLALEHCAKARRDIWRVATEAEAGLYLGHPSAALEKYRGAVAMQTEPWQLVSIGQQAYQIAMKLGDRQLQEELQSLFSPESRQVNKIFVSYSHRNKDWLERLQIMMKPFLRDGELDVWDDTRLKPGQKWLDEINNALRSCRAAVLLVSKEFLASDFILNQELPAVLDAADRGEIKLLWVYVSPSLYQETRIKEFQAVYDPAQALTRLPEAEQEEALMQIAVRIKAAVFD